MSATRPTTRQERAEQIKLTDVRRISETIWEVDAINEDGESRENLTIIPERIYSPTKDMQHRGPKGVVGKYIRALALEDAEARDQLNAAIRERRDRIRAEISDLQEELGNLTSAQQEL